MLAHPRHPDPVPSSHRGAMPLARSASSRLPPSSTQHRSRAPLGTIQPPPAALHTLRDPSPPLNQPAKRDRLPSSATVDAAPPRPRSTLDKENPRRTQPTQQHDQPLMKDAQQEQPAPAPAAAEEKKAAPTASSRAKLTEQWGEPPMHIQRENVWLQRGDLLGEGGFARVYLCTEPDGITYKALKVIDKQQLKSTKTKSKLFAEIKIHQAMQHPNIIAFEHCFEDDGNVYMQLELCSNGSLLDLLRLRKRYSEPEARFYLTQLVGACDYMHSNSVIHRDLKLGNLMLDENMDLRVGDFGLAALVKFPGERKKTICGTPNYIAPEILFDTKGGHSFEVDIWSIGVILYTLLIGRPPFQTKDVKNIYRKIRDNAYTFPLDHSLSPEAVDLISWILRPTPSERPSLAEILAHPWFVTGPFPARVSPRAADPSRAREVCEEWRYMTKRQARDNFRRVKRRAGIVEPEETGAAAVAPAPAAHVSQALPVVAEAVEEEQEGEGEERRRPRLVKREEEREAKGRIEKEVRAATAPESPISELLRSARKPLMVSPSSRGPPPRSALGQRATAADSLQSRLAAASAVPSSSAAAASVPPQQPAFRATSAPERERGRATSGSSAEKEKEREKDAAAAAVAEPGTPRSRHRRATAQSHADVRAMQQPQAPLQRAASTRAAAAPAVTSSTGSGHPLYDTTRTLFDLFLSCSSSSDLARASASIPALGLAFDVPEDEPAPPSVFLTSWVDYTHKYGTAYSLTDGTAGVYFNDSTTMVLSPNKEHFDYIQNRRANVYTRKNHAMSSLPSSAPSAAAGGDDLERKAYLLRYFEDYMAKTLRRDLPWQWEDRGRTRNMDFLVKYYRMKNAIVFKLSNDVLQFNFYDHTKLVISLSGLSLTFISPSFELTTFSLPALFAYASSAGLYSRARSARTEEDPELAEAERMVGRVEYARDVLKQLGERRREKEALRAEERRERKERERDAAGR
ncbi:hypothetical protein JCM10207_004850 [Rhodosporidiobolus poonsookiae]